MNQRQACLSALPRRAVIKSLLSHCLAVVKTKEFRIKVRYSKNLFYWVWVKILLSATVVLHCTVCGHSDGALKQKSTFHS